MAALLCCGCDWHKDVYFDTPFAYIFDNAGSSSATIDSRFGKGRECADRAESLDQRQ